jgi:transcriptional regulator with GAF, ATPase, and Fis domain
MKVDENEFFRQVTIRICGSLDIQLALEKTFEYIKDLIPARGLGLFLLDPDLSAVHIVALVEPEGEEVFRDLIALPEEIRDVAAAHWANMKQIEIINRPELHPKISKIHEAFGKKRDVSVLGMRLELEGNRVGSLSIEAEGNDRYSEEDARLMRMLHEPFAIAMANALRHKEVLRLKDLLADDNRYLHRQLRELSGSEIIGADFGLKGVMKMVGQVASLDSPVLLLGETGTGKDVIANAIHFSSPRKDGPFIKVNCGAIPETLLDSELFGHEKGAFTGATAQKRGRFERADKGTIFLDEIGELPPQAQVRLLHVLQSREIERVGGTETIPVDVRIISATHRNLEGMIETGQFREDLWFRLNVFPIMIPPLRQRKEDIPEIVNHFIERKTRDLKLGIPPKLAPGAFHRLMSYNWPGNVRELENEVERTLIQHMGGLLTFENRVTTRQEKDETMKVAEKTSQVLSLDELNTLHIERVLDLAKGKISGPEGVAQLLGIHPNTLRKRMDKLGILYRRRERSLS